MRILNPQILVLASFIICLISGFGTVFAQTTCNPTLKEIYNLKVGDELVFGHYSEVAFDVNKVGRGFSYHSCVITEDLSHGDTVMYVFEGEYPSIGISTDPRETYMKDDTILFVDSFGHFLNSCYDSLVAFTSYGNLDLYSYCSPLIVGTDTLKTFGGWETFYRENDSLKDFSEFYLTIGYDKTVGLRLWDLFWFEEYNRIELSKFIRNLDTTFYPIGIATSMNDELIKIFPNPTTGDIYIKPLNHRKIEGLEITDESGRPIPHSQYDTKYTLDRITPGTYLVRIQLDNEICIRKFIVVQ